MSYNFDKIIDRTGTGAMKVEGYLQYIFGRNDIALPFDKKDLIHLWVADMDFATPDFIRDAIKDRLDQEILGYTSFYDDRYYDAFSSWCRKKYDWKIKKEELFIKDGIVSALNELTGLILEDDKKVLIHTPAYGPFKGAAVYNRKWCVYSDLFLKDGKYSIDFEDMEKKIKEEEIGLLIFCNPHNPTGRMWNEEELLRLAEIIRKYDLWVISDEIHCDLTRTGKKHIPLAKYMDSYDKIITCMAPSKTFNTAGLHMSNVIIANEELRKKWLKRNWNNLNPLSYAGVLAAYEKGEGWLEEVKAYLDFNMKTIKEELSKTLPKAVFEIPDATYLAWVDLSAYFDAEENIALYLAKKAGVIVEGAANFVSNGDGYIRINAACPNHVLKDAMKRMAEAINNR